MGQRDYHEGRLIATEEELVPKTGQASNGARLASELTELSAHQCLSDGNQF